MKYTTALLMTSISLSIFAAPGATRPPLSTFAGQSAPQATNIQVAHYYGQTFISWTEDPVVGESYRFYRSNQPIGNSAGAQAIEVGGVPVELWENSGEFYADREFTSTVCSHAAGGFLPRFLDRLCVPMSSATPACSTGGAPTASVRKVLNTPREGLLVWTPHPGDSVAQYYAVTTVFAGVENTICVGGQNTNSQPITEQFCDPMPLDVTGLVYNATLPNNTMPLGQRLYLQYMDLREWNATFHAPNATNCWWGEDPSKVEIQHALQYAYVYAVREPDSSWYAPNSGFSPPWPVILDLHQRAANRLKALDVVTVADPGPAILISPIDVSDTWWFGFSGDYDYRYTPTPMACGTLIPDCNSNRPDPSILGLAPYQGEVVNFTEHRLLRMIYELTRDQNFSGLVDDKRVYAQGHSMGGSGALSLALHFPGVFAATASSKPMTDFAGYLSTVCGPGPLFDYSDEIFVRWGNRNQGINLPMKFMGPNHWADYLALHYAGTPVWDWMDHEAQMAVPKRKLDEMSPFGIENGKRDNTIPVGSQGVCVYPAFGEAKRVWGGLIDCTGHGVVGTYLGLPPSLTYEFVAPSSTLAAKHFSNYGVRLDETMPGFSSMVLNPPSGLGGLPCPPASASCGITPEMGTYYHNLMWSSSWNSWDKWNGNTAHPGTPIDQSNLLVVSVRFLGCGTAVDAAVDLTPRRCQSFNTRDQLANYKWQNQDIATGVLTPLTPQSVSIGADGLLTIPAFHVTGVGNRLILIK